MKIAMVSEHASPLAVLGGVDAGGQNVHVAALAGALGRPRPRRRRLHPARRRRRCRSVVPLAPGVDGRPRAGRPARAIAKDELLPFMPRVRSLAGARDWRRTGPPDVVHAHFWMSGLAALQAPGRARRPGRADLPRPRLGQAPAPGRGATPARRSGSTRESDLVAGRVDAVIATCSDEVAELRALGVAARPGARRARAASTSTLSAPARRSPRAWPRPTCRLLSVGRLVRAQGRATR